MAKSEAVRMMSIKGGKFTDQCISLVARDSDGQKKNVVLITW